MSDCEKKFTVMENANFGWVLLRVNFEGTASNTRTIFMIFYLQPKGLLDDRVCIYTGCVSLQGFTQCDIS